MSTRVTGEIANVIVIITALGIAGAIVNVIALLCFDWGF